MEQLGRYKIREEIGTGAYATVYDAQEGVEHHALKVLNDEVVPPDPAARAGLVRFLQSLKRIAHPSAVRVADAGDQEGKLFVVMELMQCPTLAKVLEQKKRLEEQQVVLFVRQAAQALDIARDVGLFHGDLNPRNAFVVSRERIKLSDFALRSLIEEPPRADQIPEEGAAEVSERDEDDQIVADDLLAAMGPGVGEEKMEEDFIGLAGLMMSMFGVDVPSRQTGESLEDYREGTMQAAYGEITDPDSGVGVHIGEVVRRLLTPGGFDSPGEVVVELASAMLLRRGPSRGGVGPTQAAAPSAAGETARVAAEPAEQEAPPVGGPEGLDPLAFQGDPREGAFTPFFIWSDRHGGRFFVVYEGERLSLGRDPDMADMVLMDPAISRRHCILSKNGGVIELEDLGSTNGTFVNEQRVHDTVEIGPEDDVRVGTTRLYMTLPSRDIR